MSQIERSSEGVIGAFTQADLDRLVIQGAAERVNDNVIRLTKVDPEKFAKAEEDYGRRFEELREEHRRRQEEASRKLDREG